MFSFSLKQKHPQCTPPTQRSIRGIIGRHINTKTQSLKIILPSVATQNVCLQLDRQTGQLNVVVCHISSRWRTQVPLMNRQTEDLSKLGYLLGHYYEYCLLLETVHKYLSTSNLN